jgi:predicted transcriptional regulator
MPGGEYMELLTVREQVIMLHVWGHGEGISLGNLIDAVSRETGWDYNRNTISTYVMRLTKKGYLKTEHRGRECIIHPTISISDMIQMQVKQVAELCFEGDISKVQEIVMGM